MDAIGDYDSDEEEIDEGEFYRVTVNQVDNSVEDIPDLVHRKDGASRFAGEAERVETGELSVPGEAKLRAARGMAYPQTGENLRTTQRVGTNAVPDRADHVARQTYGGATSCSHPYAHSQLAEGRGYSSKGDQFPAADAYPDTDDQFPATDAYPDTNDQFLATDAYPDTDHQFISTKAYPDRGSQYPAAESHPDTDDQLPATDVYPDTDDQFPVADADINVGEQFLATTVYRNTGMQFAPAQNNVTCHSDSDTQLAAKSTVNIHASAQHKAMRSNPDTDDVFVATGAHPQPNDEDICKHTVATSTVSSNADEKLAARQKAVIGACRDVGDIGDNIEPTLLSTAEVSEIHDTTTAHQVPGMQPSALGATVTGISVKTAEPFGARNVAAAEATGIYPDTDNRFGVTQWREYLDPETKCTYFYHEDAGVSTWDEPASYIPVEEPPVVPDGWLATLDPDSGCYYYYHIASQKSYWEQPGDVYSNLEPEVADRLRSLRGESIVSPKLLPQIDFMDVRAPRYAGAIGRGPTATQARDVQQGRAQRLGAAEAARRALARAATPSRAT